MWWRGVLFVAPLWSMISAQLFLQAWLAFANAIISGIGFATGRVERKKTALGIGVGLLSRLLFSLLLRGGFWVLSDLFAFGYSIA